MKKIFLLVCVTLTLLFISCEKENSGNDENGTLAIKFEVQLAKFKSAKSTNAIKSIVISIEDSDGNLILENRELDVRKT